MQTSADVWTFSVDVSDTETNIKSRLDYINETCNEIYNELVQQFDNYVHNGISMDLSQIVYIQDSIVDNVDII